MVLQHRQSSGQMRLSQLMVAIAHQTFARLQGRRINALDRLPFRFGQIDLLEFSHLLLPRFRHQTSIGNECDNGTVRVLNDTKIAASHPSGPVQHFAL